ncbi:ComEC/Rec2 family competence protein [Parabacteroides sp. OttesenSCG-928-G07]|nr:ComEC/Rec2 family competence protein [Parabacteroides sp. OttesenSCG-928-G21]MDL2277600.1 ComEC/Rec2 family competence protein [Parabacteroides sp. OttesenSCG-928-G07]
MILELQKRPFVRPLFIWIAGILLQAFFSYKLIVGVSLFLLCGLLIFYFKKEITYSRKWVWGMCFAVLLLALSVLVTEYAEKRLMMKNTTPNRMEQLALDTQQQLVKTFDRLDLNEREKSLLATLTFGYRQQMDFEVKQKFSLSGVSHILAVSGFHVAIVGSFISLLFGFLPVNGVGKWMKYIISLLLLWSFVWIAGLAASAIRAGFMYSLYLTGRTINRAGDSYNTLAAAAFCMLVYNPFYLFDVGFQLSFMAVWFILYLQPRFEKIIIVRNPLLRYPWNWLTVTLAAQTGTAFLCLYYFGYFSLVFLFTNPVITLVTTFLIPAGLLWALIPESFVHSYIAPVIKFLIDIMFWTVDSFSALPLASLSFPFDFISLVTCYVLLFLFILYNRKRRPPLLLSALLIAFLWLVYLIFLSNN